MVALRVFLLSLVAWTAILGGLWLVPAGLVPGGTWVWPRGLWATSLFSIIQAAGAAAFASRMSTGINAQGQSPALASETRSGWRDPLIDVFGIAYGLIYCVFIPLDVFQLHLLPRPSIALSIAGGATAVLGLVLMHVSILQHASASGAHGQSGQASRIISNGLYGVVRHPMYLGALLWLSGAALWLESFAALIASVGVFAFILVRVAIEEAHLRKSLPGYVAYATRVRSRLLPFVI